jgi:hypothetical protein
MTMAFCTTEQMDFNVSCLNVNMQNKGHVKGNAYDWSHQLRNLIGIKVYDKNVLRQCLKQWTLQTRLAKKIKF